MSSSNRGVRLVIALGTMSQPSGDAAIRPTRSGSLHPAAATPGSTPGAVVAAPTFDRAFARWCLTVECDKPRRWAAAFSDRRRGPRRPRRPLGPSRIERGGPSRQPPGGDEPLIAAHDRDRAWQSRRLLSPRRSGTAAARRRRQQGQLADPSARSCAYRSRWRYRCKARGRNTAISASGQASARATA